MLQFQPSFTQNSNTPKSQISFLDYQKTWSSSHLKSAITLAESEVKTFSGSPRERARHLCDLASYLSQKYFRDDHDYDGEPLISDLKKGITYAQEAVWIITAEKLDAQRWRSTAMLAELLMKVWDEDKKRTEDQLKRAVEMSRLSVWWAKKSGIEDTAWESWMQLAEVLEKKGLAYGEEKFLREGIECAEKAHRAVVRVDKRKEGLVLASLAEKYMSVITLTGNQGEKGKAVQYATLAVQATELQSPDRDAVFLTWARILNDTNSVKLQKL
jgi:hypothetical protein